MYGYHDIMYIVLAILAAVNVTFFLLQLLGEIDVTTGEVNISSDSVIQMIIASGTIGAVIGTVHFARITQRSNALDKVLGILNAKDAKEARKTILSTYKQFAPDKYSLEDDIPEKDLEKEYVEEIIGKYRETALQVREAIQKVRSDYEQIGIYARHKIIDKDALLDAYWRSILLCWYALRGNIGAEKRERDNTPYFENFKRLADDARRYWGDHYEEAKLNYY